MRPPRITARGRLPPPIRRATTAVTGRIIRARRFQTPVTTMDVEMARREKPQERKAAYVTATPTAPPPGRRLPADDPHRFTMSAWTCRRPGSDPVRVNV